MKSRNLSSRLSFEEEIQKYKKEERYRKKMQENHKNRPV